MAIYYFTTSISKIVNIQVEHIAYDYNSHNMNTTKI